MIYRNTKTGAVIDSPCTLSGGDWIAEDELKDLAVVDEGEDETADDEEEVIKLSEMSIAKLKEFAIEHEIDLGAAKKKDEIIEVILASQE